MHRLPRHLLRPLPITRLLRVQHPLTALPSIPRHYATSVPPPTRSKDRFDRLLAALRPGLKEDELAMAIAALVTSTRNRTKLDMLDGVVQDCLEGMDQKRVYKLVNHYVQNPPAEGLDNLTTDADNGSS